MLKPMIAATASLLLLAGCERPAVMVPAAPPSVGRFVIVHSPQAERDTILLDTATGKTWSRVEVSDMTENPPAWDPMPQLNTPADLDALAVHHPMARSNAPKSGR